MMRKVFCVFLLLCFAVTMLAACEDSPMDKISDDDLVTYYVTDENGSIETDEEGKPVIKYITDAKTEETPGGMEVKTNDDEIGWSELIPFD